MKKTYEDVVEHFKSNPDAMCMGLAAFQLQGVELRKVKAKYIVVNRKQGDYKGYLICRAG